MKPLRKHLKLIALFIAVTFLLQSCSVYKGVDYETAIKSGKKVKVTLNDNQSYKFIKIYEEDNQLIGVANIKSKTTKNFNNNPTSENKLYKYYVLNKDEILKLRQNDPVISTVIGVVIIIGGIILLEFAGGIGFSGGI